MWQWAVPQFCCMNSFPLSYNNQLNNFMTDSERKVTTVPTPWLGPRT